MTHDSRVRIGFVPTREDLDHPADRRRFLSAAKHFDLEFEIADTTKSYDVLYLSIAANFFDWLKYIQNLRVKNNSSFIVFEMCDDLLESGPFIDFLRLLSLSIKSKRILPFRSHKELLKSLIAVSDIVVCGSPEQERNIKKIASETVVVRDYFKNEFYSIKEESALCRSGEVNIVWEGMSHGNHEIFIKIRSILKLLDLGEIKIKLHIITDPKICRLGGKYFCQPTRDYLANVFKNLSVTVYTYDWNEVLLNSLLPQLDLAIIPIPHNSVMQMKPENKLLLFWGFGVPVVVSDTPAYKRVMEQAGLEFSAGNDRDFANKMEKLLLSEEERDNYSRCSREFTNNVYGDNFFSDNWHFLMERMK